MRQSCAGIDHSYDARIHRTLGRLLLRIVGLVGSSAQQTASGLANCSSAITRSGFVESFRNDPLRGLTISVWDQSVMPIELSNDMLARGCDSGCAPSTSCEGRQLSSFQLPPCIRCWALSNLLLGQAAFRGRNREPFSESRMREMRLSGSMSGNRKQSHAKPD